MCTGHGRVERNNFAIREDMVNFEMQVGESETHGAHHLLEMLGEVRAERFLMINAVGCDLLINHRKITLIERALYKFTR